MGKETLPMATVPVRSYSLEVAVRETSEVPDAQITGGEEVPYRPLPEPDFGTHTEVVERVWEEIVRVSKALQSLNISDPEYSIRASVLSDLTSTLKRLER